MSGGPVAADLVLGSTLLLGGGAVVAWVARAPVHAQRAAELSVAATLVWLALAMVPLPRWTVAPVGSAVAESMPVAEAAGAGAVAPRSLPVGAGRHGEREAGRSSKRVAPGALAGRLAWVWGFGSAIAVAYLLAGVLLVRRLLALGSTPPPWLAALFAARCRAAGVRRVRLIVGAGRCRPMCAGVLRPVVVLPARLAERSRRLELRRVMDHELVHVRRCDAVSRMLFALAAPLLWPHPLFWILRRRASLAAELIADDRAGEADRHAYARGLLALADEFRYRRSVPLIASGTFRNRTELARRIEMLANHEGGLATRCTPARRAAQAAMMLLGVGVSAALFGARGVPAQERGTPGGSIEAEPPASVAVAVPDRAVDENPARPAAAPVSPQSEAAPAAAPIENAGTAGDEALPAAPTEVGARAAAQDPDFASALELVDRALSLRTELEMTQAELVAIERSEKLGQATESQLLRLRVQLQGLERRLETVLILVRSEIQAIQLEMAQLEEAVQLGTEGPAARIRQVRLAGWVEVLRSVL